MIDGNVDPLHFASLYKDLDDHQTLLTDLVLQVAAGKFPDGELPLAFPPTLCRLENRIDRSSLPRSLSISSSPHIRWICSPTGRVATDSWRTNSACCSVPRRTCWCRQLRRTALAGTELAQAQVGTIRLKLFQVAARVVSARWAVFQAVNERLTDRRPVAAAEGG